MRVSRRVRLALVVLVWLATVAPVASTRADTRSADASAVALDSGWNVDLIGHIGGGDGNAALAVQAPYAYVGFGAELAILDISNAARPARIGYVLLPKSAVDIALAGHYVYVLHADSNISLVDVSEPQQPTVISTSANLSGSFASHIVLSGSYAYTTWVACDRMFGCHGGLQIVDISNPTHPTPVGTYAKNTTIGSLSVVGTLAYVVIGDELQILNVSDPSAVQMVGIHILPAGASDLVVAGAYAYIPLLNCEVWCDAGSLAIVDLSNLAVPRAVGSVVTPGGPQAIAVSGDIAYVTTTSTCATGCRGGLAVIDVARPTAPRVIGRLNIDSPFNHDLAAVNNNVFISGLNGLHVVDVTGLRTPRQVGFYGLPRGGDDVEVEGDYAYLIDGRLHVINIADPAMPYETGFYDAPAAADDLDVAGRYAYITWYSGCAPDCHSGLRIVDISNPAAPRQVGAYDPSTGVHTVTVAGRYAYVTYTAWYLNGCVADCPSTLTLVDVATPSKPRAVGVYSAPNPIASVAVAGAHAYVSTAAGLRIVDVSDPTTPREIAVYAASESLGAVAFSGNFVYLSRNAGMQILDVSNPTAPREVGFYVFDGFFGVDSVEVAGRYAYVSNWTKLHVVDISNPAAPRAVGVYDFNPGDVNGMAVADGSLYLAQSGLSILKFTGPPAIAGRVGDLHGRPFAGVTLAVSDGQTVSTGTTGAYSLTNVFSGTYRLAPALAGYAFDPPVRTVTLPPNPGRQDFTILPGPVSTSLTPGAAASLTYTDTQGLPTRLEVPIGAVSQTVTLALTPTLVARAGSTAFAGHAFDLAILEQDVAKTDFRFGAPVTVTIRYSDLDVWAVSDERQITFQRWTGGGWQDATETCPKPAAIVRDTASHLITLAICQAGRFGLFGPTHPIFLPIGSG